MRTAIGLTLTLTAASVAGAQTLYVDANLTTGSGDGSSWANAMQGPGALSQALAAAPTGGQIFVADGLYLPSLSGDRTQTFELANRVQVYGGFAGGEAGLAARPEPGAFPSILSGDLAGDDLPDWLNRADNSYHVVTAGLPSTATLDGFTVCAGSATGFGSGSSNDGGGLLLDRDCVVRNCVFTDNQAGRDGGAIGGLFGDLVAEDCTFVGNRATGSGEGGAIGLRQAGIEVRRCKFIDNRAASGGALYLRANGGLAAVESSLFLRNRANGALEDGGAVFLDGSSCALTCCTFVDNFALRGAVAEISTAFPSPRFQSCIFFGNRNNPFVSNPVQHFSGSAVTVLSSLFEVSPVAGAGNAVGDPLFRGAADDDYRLLAASPAIDSGNASGLNLGVARDLLGRPRAFDEPSVPNTGTGGVSYVDRGAYEYTSELGTPRCPAGVNSAGRTAVLRVLGSPVAQDNDVGFRVSGLPNFAIILFLASRTPAVVPGAGGSFGTLCLGGSIGRFNRPGQIQPANGLGVLTLRLDLQAIPSGSDLVTVVAGETWFYQAWHRDNVFDPGGSNFTNAVEVRFE